MAARGRKSSASLAIVTAIPGQRAEPLVELSSDESEIWRSVVSTKPAEWFGADSFPLLANFCRHTIRQRLLSEQINQFDTTCLTDEDGLKRFDLLLKMSDRESKAVAMVATKLRLTQQSRYTPQAAATANKNTAKRKPWED